MFESTVAIDPRAGRGGTRPPEEAPLFWVKATPYSDGGTNGWHFAIEPIPSVRPGTIVFRSREAMWFYNGGGSCSEVTKHEETGDYYVYTNSIMVFIHRVVGGLLDVASGFVAVRVTLTTVSGRTVEFSTDVTLSLTCPTHFKYIFVEQALNDFCTPHDPATVPVADVDVPGDIVPFTDEVTGDLVSEAGASTATASRDVVESDMLRPLTTSSSSDDFSVLQDCSLARSASGVAKLKWLAEYLVREVEPGGRILVGGDHPGTASRALVDAGYDVCGVDPRNETVTRRGNANLGSGVYQQLRGRVSVGTVEDDYGVDWGGCLFDVATNERSAEEDTAVNLGLARKLSRLGVPVAVAKTRSVPLSPGSYFLLDSPGWEVRGCEAYLRVRGKDTPWTPAVRCAVRVLEERDYVLVRWQDADGSAGQDAPPWLPWFFERDRDGWWHVPNKKWYHFVGLRSVDFAKARANTGLGKEITNAWSATEAWLALRAHFGDVDVAVREQVSARFRTDDFQGARGVPRSALHRVPGLLGTMAGRYHTLLSLCQDPGGTCPPELGYLMKHPGAGALLSDLSQVRGLMGETQVSLADYSRVLPWNSMAILASDLFFRLFYWLALSMSRIYKPWHAWELQHRLWSLSAFGTDAERFIYFLDQFEHLFRGVDQARNFSRKEGAMERALRRFDENLDGLNIRDDFLRFDRPYSLTISMRAKPFDRRRGARAAPARGGTAYSASTGRAPSTAPPVHDTGPIRDLADFGIDHGWDSSTPLHTVLSATRGRADAERAYAYWISLSPVERPMSIPHSQWRPRQPLNSRDALAYKLPGLDNPHSFTRVRDAQLEELLRMRQ